MLTIELENVWLFIHLILWYDNIRQNSYYDRFGRFYFVLTDVILNRNCCVIFTDSRTLTNDLIEMYIIFGDLDEIVSLKYFVQTAVKLFWFMCRNWLIGWNICIPYGTYKRTHTHYVWNLYRLIFKF